MSIKGKTAQADKLSSIAFIKTQTYITLWTNNMILIDLQAALHNASRLRATVINTKSKSIAILIFQFDFNNRVISNYKFMFSLDDINFLGYHNLLNALNASTIASIYGVSDDCIVSSIKKIKHD